MRVDMHQRPVNYKTAARSFCKQTRFSRFYFWDRILSCKVASLQWASLVACYLFICTNLKQTRNTRPIRQFTMAGTLQVAKLWHAGFSYVQTSSKPCSNLNSMGPDHATRCDTILKESSINFLFLSAATVDFLCCLELRFDWGLYI